MTRAVLEFSLFAALLTITPGLDTALVIRMSLAGGARTGRLAGAGVCTGVLVWGFASAVGITALLTASQHGYDLLRIVGAVYLVSLGVRAIFSKPKADDDERTADDGATGGRKAFRTGLLTNLLNPKVGVFYLSALPQFIPAHAPVLATSMLLAGLHALEGIIWLSVVATLVHRLGSALRRPSVKRRLEQVTGIVLIGFGVRLALEKR